MIWEVSRPGTRSTSEKVLSYSVTEYRLPSYRQEDWRADEWERVIYFFFGDECSLERGSGETPNLGLSRTPQQKVA